MELTIPTNITSGGEFLRETAHQCITQISCNEWCRNLHLSMKMADTTYIIIVTTFVVALCISRIFVYYPNKNKVESLFIFMTMITLIVYFIMLMLNLKIATLSGNFT